MTHNEHDRAVARLYAAAESRWRWHSVYLPLLRGLTWGLAVAACVWALSVAGDCGDVRGEPRPDAEAFALVARLRAWQPTHRERHAGDLAAVAAAIVSACHADPWPDAARCPYLLASLTFRESSWQSKAIGRRGEMGLGQLHGAALAGESRESAMDPDVNLRLTLAWLRRCSALCRLAEHGEDEAALSAYAGLRCRPSRGAAMVLRWERDLREGGAR